LLVSTPERLCSRNIAGLQKPVSENLVFRESSDSTR
jgi:hypothetical protein